MLNETIHCLNSLHFAMLQIILAVERTQKFHEKAQILHSLIFHFRSVRCWRGN